MLWQGAGFCGRCGQQVRDGKRGEQRDPGLVITRQQRKQSAKQGALQSLDTQSCKLNPIVCVYIPSSFVLFLGPTVTSLSIDETFFCYLLEIINIKMFLFQAQNKASVGSSKKSLVSKPHFTVASRTSMWSAHLCIAIFCIVSHRNVVISIEVIGV